MWHTAGEKAKHVIVALQIENGHGLWMLVATF